MSASGEKDLFSLTGPGICTAPMVLAIALQQDWAYAFPTADNVWIFAKVTSVIYLFNLWSTG